MLDKDYLIIGLRNPKGLRRREAPFDASLYDLFLFCGPKLVIRTNTLISVRRLFRHVIYVLAQL